MNIPRILTVSNPNYAPIVFSFFAKLNELLNHP